jgi:nucleobase:cation symporter-1, NCS1 family
MTLLIPRQNPLLIIDHWHGSSGGRAAAFFASACWCLAQICLNISANSLSFANDVTSLLPKYINIFRGQVICFLLGGWALCPWLVLKSAQTFLSFMSAYAIFMAPLASLLLADYWIIKKRRYDVPALYDPDGIYGKCNWRSLLILAVVILPLMPGLAQRVTPDNVNIPDGMRHLFAINYMYGFVSAMVLYLVLNWIWPDKKTLIPYVVHGTPVTDIEVDQECKAGSESPTPKNTDNKEPKTQATVV